MALALWKMDLTSIFNDFYYSTVQITKSFYQLICNFADIISISSMIEKPLITVCIPAYKNIEFLKRLFDSIAIQTFHDFEVVVTDDSPDMEVKTLCEAYNGQFLIRYFRNEPSKGTPENWNEGVRKAAGKWIKIMHDDDWFACEDSLSTFADGIRTHPNASFFFSAYRDIFLDEGRQREMFVDKWRLRAFLKEHATLFSKNIVGPPSVVLYRSDPTRQYDPRVKWVVDIDFYMQYLKSSTPVYIRKILINVGLGSQQVTKDCFGLRPVEIPENFYLLNKVGVVKLKNWLVYDAWWRLMRNLEIRRPEEIREAGYAGEIPPVILSMLKWQRPWPKSLLQIGFFSKTVMFLHYIFHYNRITV